MDAHNLRDFATDAMRYREPRRIVYNLVLSTIVMGYFVAGLPASKHSVSIDSLFFLFILAVLANVAYCAAYIPDVFAQASGFREAWQKYRWVLFIIGLLFAGILTRFWSLAFFSPAAQ